MKGVITALITPFTESGAVDETGFIENLRFQMENGVEGILLFGSTGEGATLNDEEKTRLVRLAKQEAKGNCHVMVSTGTNATASSIRLAKWAEELGADSCLVVTPYYNKPMPEGVYLHYEAISQAIKLPIYIYHIPGRTACKLPPSILKRLIALPNIKGVKVSTGDFFETNEMLEDLPDHFTFLSGDDGLTLPLISLGAKGVVSVASNVIPQEIKDLVNACLEGNFSKAREIHFSLNPFFRALFVETNPIPVKAFMNERGMAAGPCRLPLTHLSRSNQPLIQEMAWPDRILI